VKGISYINRLRTEFDGHFLRHPSPAPGFRGHPHPASSVTPPPLLRRVLSVDFVKISRNSAVRFLVALASAAVVLFSVVALLTWIVKP
jgi:hypothetical protein